MFRGKKVELKPIDSSYLDRIMERWNNVELKQFLNGAIPHSRKGEEEWLIHAQDQMTKMQAFVFAIERLDTGKFIGTMGIHDIQWVPRSAEIGIAIYDEEDHGQGFGTEAMQLAIEFAWRDLNLRRLELAVYDFNTRAIRTYEKVGFKRYGTAHQKMFIRGQYRDVHYMEIFRDQE